ncbi:hypothetical protein HOY80DRAFT_689486 [Tuber brumale]|nr:hypothetical protein HOY80DRAFT_689486 [Tuber brumale]
MTSTPSHHPSLPFGLRWESNFYGPVPAWAATPNVVAIEALSRQHLGADNLSVKYLAGGVFNKVYLIRVPSDNILDPKSYLAIHKVFGWFFSLAPSYLGGTSDRP